MREIKLRAWDTKANYMVAEYFQLKNTPKRYILLQFTGLRDKNGREIYEGDILKFDYGIEVGIGLARVHFLDGGFWLRVNNHNFMPSAEVREIIGNIYENSELLKAS